jgi:hypothetical protein
MSIRHFIDLTEAAFKKVETEYGIEVKVWSQPTVMMAKRLLASWQHGARGLVFDDRIYLWDAEEAIHADIAHLLRNGEFWGGFAVVPEGDDLVIGDYDLDGQVMWKTYEGYTVYYNADAKDADRVKAMFPEVTGTL